MKKIILLIMILGTLGMALVSCSSGGSGGISGGATSGTKIVVWTPTETDILYADLELKCSIYDSIRTQLDSFIGSGEGIICGDFAHVYKYIRYKGDYTTIDSITYIIVEKVADSTYTVTKNGKTTTYHDLQTALNQVTF